MSLTAVLFLMALASLEGRDGDFEYVPIVDGNQVPMVSYGDQSPLYEGLRVKDGLMQRVISSETTLRKNYHLSEPPIETSPWTSKTLRLKISPAALAHFLNYFQRNPERLASYFAGSTEAKAHLITALLAGGELSLRDQELKALKRSATNPEPDSLKIFIPLDLGRTTGERAWNLFTLMQAEIRPDKLWFDFQAKDIRFEPDTQSFRIRLEARQAKMSGPIRKIGEWDFGVLQLNRVIPKEGIFWFLPGKKENEESPIWQFGRFHDRTVYLQEGLIGPLSIEASIRFVRRGEDLWQLELARPLKLESIEELPLIRLTPSILEDGRDSMDVPFNQQTRDLVEQTLAGTLRSSFENYFFAVDLGLPLPVKKADDAKVAFQTRLSDVRVDSDGLILSFDSRIAAEQVATCALPLWQASHNETEVAEAPSLFDPNAKKDFVLRDLIDPLEWRALKASDRRVSLSFSPAFFSQIVLLSAAAGDLCWDSGDLWRSDVVLPRMLIQPLERPRIRFIENEFQIEAPLGFQYAHRTQKLIDDRWVYRTQRKLRLQVTGGIASENNLFIEPRLQISGMEEGDWSKEENELMTSLLDVGVQAWLRKSGFVDRPLMEVMEEKFLPKDFQADSLRLTDNGVVTVFTPQILEAFFERKKEEESKPLVPIIRPQSSFRTAIAPRLRQSPLRIRFGAARGKEWDDALVYSWCLRTPSQPDACDGSGWQPMSHHQEALIPLREKGRYEFFVRSMNRAYEIEEVPILYDFIFDPSPETPVSEVVKDLPTPPKENVVNKSEPPVVQVTPAPSRGLFGCSLQSGSSVASMGVLVSGLIALLLVGLLRYLVPLMPQHSRNLRRNIKGLTRHKS